LGRFVGLFDEKNGVFPPVSGIPSTKAISVFIPVTIKFPAGANKAFLPAEGGASWGRGCVGRVSVLNVFFRLF